MISTNALSVFILHHHQNGICNKNIHSIQEIMHTSEPDFQTYKKVCNDLPNITILTKSVMPGEVQLTFAHVSVGNTSLGRSVAAFALAGSLDLPSIVSIDITLAFDTDSDKIRLPITELLLCTAAGDLARSKNQQD